MTTRPTDRTHITPTSPAQGSAAPKRGSTKSGSEEKSR